MCFCVSRTLPKKNLSLTRIHEHLLAIRLTLYLMHWEANRVDTMPMVISIGVILLETTKGQNGHVGAAPAGARCQPACGLRNEK